MSVVGRICCDTNGKLNASSLILRESGTNHSGMSVPLNVTDVNEYSLFPGKVSMRESYRKQAKKLGRFRTG